MTDLNRQVRPVQGGIVPDQPATESRLEATTLALGLNSSGGQSPPEVRCSQFDTPLAPGSGADQFPNPTDSLSGAPEPDTGGRPDPFDPARLRLSQDFAAAAGVRKIITTIPVRKPSKEWFVRTHPHSDFRLATAVLELKEDRETYLVDRSLWEALEMEPIFSARLLVLSVNRQGVAFLWPIRLPGPDGKIDGWSQSALDAAEFAKTSWVRVSANMSLGAYDIVKAPAQVAEPTWPALSFGDILKLAFRNRMISSWDDPILLRLRGEV